jgi:hypothetical protein
MRQWCRLACLRQQIRPGAAKPDSAGNSANATGQVAADPTPFVNCAVTLHTDRVHFGEDLRRLARVVKTIRLALPEE